jgi:hypothetical protein
MSPDPSTNNDKPQLPPGSTLALITIWLLTILVVQFATWATMALVDIDASWKECGLVAALWVFVSVWFSALRTKK